MINVNRLKQRRPEIELIDLSGYITRSVGVNNNQFAFCEIECEILDSGIVVQLHTNHLFF